MFITGGTETWKNSQTKEKYIMCHSSSHSMLAIYYIVDSAAEEYNAFFYSLVSSVSTCILYCVHYTVAISLYVTRPGRTGLIRTLYFEEY